MARFGTQCTGDGNCKKDARYRTASGAPVCFLHYHRAKAATRKHVEVSVPGNIVNRRRTRKKQGKALAEAVGKADK